jgi:hypothetical protein
MIQFEPKNFDFWEWGAFFAFSNKRFEEQKQEGEKYISFDGGLLAKKSNYKEMFNALNQHDKSEKKRRASEMWLDAIIKYELNNHEVYYTWDIQDAWEVLEWYWATLDRVRDIFFRERDLKAMNDEI